jgi:manganese-dependent inorganic pyrophosphatase
VEPKTIEAAQKNKVSLITSPHDTATTASLCRAAVAVRHVLNEEFLCFRANAPLAAVREEAMSSGYLAFPVLGNDGETVGILSKTDFLKPVTRKLILVDHNELSQAVQGADEVEIIEIIDHHRIGALATQQPILFRNEPVGSSCTIVADCFFRHGVDLARDIAGLLLAGLVSDTLNLTSPTTTQRDVEILKQLEEISGINAREFTDKLFASGSLLTSKSDCNRLQGIHRAGGEVQRGANRGNRAGAVLEAQGRAAEGIGGIPSQEGISVFGDAGHGCGDAKFAAAGGGRREVHQAH